MPLFSAPSPIALAESAYLSLSYYFILFMVLAWVLSTARLLGRERFSSTGFLRVNRPGLLSALALAGVIFASSPPDFRILSDEVNFVSVSRTMVFEKRVDNYTHGFRFHRNVFPIRTEEDPVEAHPLLFPWLVHVLHVVSGYRPANAFAANFLLLWILLFTVWRIFRDRASPACAFSAMLLVASQPIVAQCATSGGIELFSTVMMLLTFAALSRYLKEPTGPRFEYLWMTMVLFSQVRQENFLFLALVPACLAALDRLRKEHFSPLIAWTPLFLLPMFLQRLLVENPYEKISGDCFTPMLLLKHTAKFLAASLDTGFHFPYAPPICLLGLIGLTIIPLRQRTGPARALVIIAAVTLAAHWLLLTSFFYGQPTSPTFARYFLPFTVLLSLSAAEVLRRNGYFSKHAVLVLTLSAFLFILYEPVSMVDRFTRRQVLTREYHLATEYLKKHSSLETLVIADRPGLYLIHGYAAVSPDYVMSHEEVLRSQIARHLYEDVFVVEEVRYGLQGPGRLGRMFDLTPVYAVQNSPGSFVRLSRVSLPPAQ